ncbi:MAG: TIGR02452 family protein [Myxococcales bacterium]|nr:TIGR02452 family protein [Myxococcales bacterium]
MSLKQVARDTLAICDAGSYVGPTGGRVEIGSQIEAAVVGTRLYTPNELDDLLALPGGPGAAPHIEVSDETTQVGARRLASEGESRVALLNFASARNPGGGFINGAKAQEEDVTRCSALHPCLTSPSVEAYYKVNRALDSMLYTDHIIYSPAVPFFRSRSTDLIDEPFFAGVITAPAPNAGEALKRDTGCLPAVEETLRRRAAKVLMVAADQRHRVLVLGAWGCGVFRNQPSMVADAFGQHLGSARFAGCFERVLFAVYDRSKDRGTLGAFKRRFATA